MWQLFAQRRVTLVLNGHDHDYQRFTPVDGNLNPSPTGITEIIVGSGGHGTQSQIVQDPRLVTSDFADIGALRLNLYQTSATFQFQTTTGLVVDSGLIPCRNTTDSTPPSVPASPAATAAGPGEIDLSWTASTDNIAVAGYELFKDGSPSPLATLAPDARSYADKVVAPNTSHTYTIKAFDAAGNRSSPAGPVSATTPDGTVTIVLPAAADAYVNSDSPDINFGGATVLRVGAPNGSSTATMHSYLRFDLSKVVGRIQSATLKVTPGSTNNLGFAAGPSTSAWDEYAITSTNAPSIGSTVATSGPVTNGVVANVNVGPLVAPAQGGLVSFGLSSLGGGQIPMASRETSTPPTLTIVVGSGATGVPVASFNASTTSTFTGVPVQFTDTSTGNPPTAWSWTFGGTSTSSLQSPSHAWAAAGTYTVSLVASNLYGSSAPATAQVTIASDTTAPSTPGTCRGNRYGPGRDRRSWTASTDDLAVAGYEVYKDGAGSPVATLAPSVLAYQDTAVAPSSTHSYTVKAFDGAGNHSAAGGPASATTPNGAVTYVLTPVADSYVDSLSPGINFGPNTTLRAKTGQPDPEQLPAVRPVGRRRPGGSRAPRSGSCRTRRAGPRGRVGGVADTTWGETTVTYTNGPDDRPERSARPGAVTSGVRNSVNVASLVAPAQGGLVSFGLTGTGSQLGTGVQGGWHHRADPDDRGRTGPRWRADCELGLLGDHSAQRHPHPIHRHELGQRADRLELGLRRQRHEHPAEPQPRVGSHGHLPVSLVASNLYGSSAPATAQITITGDSSPPTVPSGVSATRRPGRPRSTFRGPARPMTSA